MYSDYFTNCFIKSKYYQEIKAKYTVLMTFVGGGRLLDCITAESDYDITIIVADDFEFSVDTTKYLRFMDGVKLHWYIIPFNSILQKRIKNKNMAALFLEFKNLSDDFLLDQPDNLAYNKILEMKQELSEAGQRYILADLQYIVEQIDEIDVKSIKLQDLKSVYYLLYISYTAFGDLPDYERIRKFKRAVRY
jgi:hypothetical protein